MNTVEAVPPQNKARQSLFDRLENKDNDDRCMMVPPKSV